ncbi:hypothetical protein [Lutispora sp.]|uniref:hypothetical protein n=1 Tax=Lutispora sp. TaxID=2828727 RepID=UPI002B1F37A0|nr:hypothetical protein [Lutispora sp.]MEA4962439.1 hypothetical protein [Lutispora sp.]
MTIKEMQNLKATLGLEYISPMILSTEYINRYIIENKIDPNSIQAQALYRINEHSNNLEIQKNISGVNIFFFEGAGSYNRKDNPNHPEGRYGAMVIVVKDGRIEFISTRASTLPNNPDGYWAENEKGRMFTIDSGVYKYVSVMHKSNSPQKRYPALNVQAIKFDKKTNSIIYTDRVPGTRTLVINDPSTRYKTTGGGINIHKGIPDDKRASATSGWSTGCLTIHPNDYAQFAQTVGFASENDGSVDVNDKLYNASGFVIIDKNFQK